MVKVLVLLVVYHISLCAKLTGVSFRYKRGIGVDPKRGDPPLERAREPKKRRYHLTIPGGYPHIVMTQHH